MVAISHDIRIEDFAGDVDDLAGANAEIARRQMAAAHRAVRVVREAIVRKDAEAVRTVTDTVGRAREHAEQVLIAIGDRFSSLWNLDVCVDEYRTDELDLTVTGPFTEDQAETIAAFLTSIPWWPVRVVVMFDDIIAIDTTAVDDARAQAVARAVTRSRP